MLLNDEVDPKKIHDTIDSIKQRLLEYKDSKFSNLLPETAIYQGMVDKLDERYETLIDNLVDRLEDFEKEYIAPDNSNDMEDQLILVNNTNYKFCDGATRLNRQSHYKATLKGLTYDFETMETAISVRQKNGSKNAFVMRNKTNTNAVGVAKNELQEHVFSSDNVLSNDNYNSLRATRSIDSF
ncbi:MAG: hypothetical protein GY821_13680 [Gammaproteobacteria bacterium]|nr:hypothetical protein [Gammaproteobacteria bacterium]